MQHPVMPIAAFAAAVLVWMPFVFQRTLVRYFPLVALAVWLSLVNVIRGVNTLIWAGDAAVRIPVWCDITTKVQIGALYAIPAASFCVAAKLRLAASQHVLPVQRSEGEDRKAKIVEAAMCVGMPLLAMILHVVMQTQRFDIIEGVGCVPGAPTALGAVFFWLPALFLVMLSLALCFASWRNVLGPQRGWLQAYLENFDPSLNIRLFFSQTMVVLSLACLSVATLVVTVYESPISAPSVETARARDWTRVDVFTLQDLSARSRRNQLFCWWSMPISALSLCLWFILLPAAEVADLACQCVSQRVWHRGKSSRTVISLKDLELAKSSPNRLVVRKHSTIEIRVDDIACPDPLAKDLETAMPHEDPTQDKKWSTPWEFINSDGYMPSETSLGRPLSFSFDNFNTPNTMLVAPQDA